MTNQKLIAALFAVIASLAEADRQHLPSVTEVERQTLEKVIATLQMQAEKGAA